MPYAQTPSSHANQPCKARQPPATTTIWIAISRIRRFCLHACDQAQQRPQFPALHRLKLEIEPRLSQKMRQASLGDASLARSQSAAFRDEGARQAMIRSAMMTILYPEAEVFSAPVRHDEPRFVRRDDGLGAVTQPELA